MALVWLRYSNRVVLALDWRGIGMVLVCYWYGVGMRLVWYWHGIDMGLIWYCGSLCIVMVFMILAW